MSQPPSRKDFAPIQHDYAFFETHSTEAAQDVAGYERILAEVWHGAQRPGQLRLLDFGCGPGGFTAQFLQQLAQPPDRLSLTLVEPVEAYRQAAETRLAAFSSTPVRASATLTADTDRNLDLIVANHVLYYVPQLADVVQKLLAARAPGGVLMTSMAGSDNTLIQFWHTCFQWLGQPLPYHTAEDLQRAFAQSGVEPACQKIHYRLQFADTRGHRESLFRFLLSDYVDQLQPDDVCDLLSPYADRSGRITLEMQHDQFWCHRHHDGP